MQDHRAAMGAYPRVINSPCVGIIRRTRAEELFVYTNQGVSLSCISPGEPKNNSILLFSSVFAVSRDVFPSLLQFYHVHFGLQIQLGSERCARIWHSLSPRKAHVPAQWPALSVLPQGQSQTVCPLKALKKFCPVWNASLVLVVTQQNKTNKQTLH